MKRKTTLIICLFTLLEIARPKSGSVDALAVGPQVYSNGALTATSARKQLKDSDFAADLSMGDVASEKKDSHVEAATVDRHPVFGLSDVQSGVERVYLRNGAVVASHGHPRASETLYIESGEIITSLRFEGASDARVVRLTLRRGRVTCFPQGLPHTLTCASEAGCTYVSFFNSADYGVVAAPIFF